MGKLVATIDFKAELVLDRSITSVVEHLGEGTCTMDFYTGDGQVAKSGNGTIEWEYNLTGREDDGDCVFIGIWWQDGELTDYDGLFSLPNEAIELLRKSGITVPLIFED